MNSRFYALSFEYFERHIDKILSDLSGLVAIPSIRDENSAADNAPFGVAIREAFDYLIDFANREGLEVNDHQGYALDISYGEGDGEIAILHHVDVVSEGNTALWRTPPFELHTEGNVIFGRGVTDNKGPLMASLLTATSQLSMEKKGSCMPGYTENFQLRVTLDPAG